MEVIGKTVADLDIMTTEEINKLLLKTDCNENVIAVEVDLKAKNGDIKHVLLSSEIFIFKIRNIDLLLLMTLPRLKKSKRKLNFKLS